MGWFDLINTQGKNTGLAGGRRKIADWLAGTLAACACLTSLALADTANVRVAMHLYPTAEPSPQGLGTVSEMRDRLKTDMNQVVTGFKGCPDIVAGPLERGTPRDHLRDTWTLVQSIRVQCWAILHADPAAQVTAIEPADQITSEIIHAIMANAEKLSAEDEEWAKTLVVFPGGEIECRDRERCELSAPEGGEWSNYSMYMNLILIHDDEWFIEVAPAYRGQVSFVYGVLWRETEGGGEVISIFPDLRN